MYIFSRAELLADLFAARVIGCVSGGSLAVPPVLAQAGDVVLNLICMTIITFNIYI